MNQQRMQSDFRYVVGTYGAMATFTIAGLTLRLKVNLFQSSCPHLACNRAPMTPENLLLESGNDWPVVPGLQVIILQKGSALTGGSRCYQNAKQHHKLRITVAIDDTRRRLTERCNGN